MGLPTDLDGGALCSVGNWSDKPTGFGESHVMVLVSIQKN